MTSKFHCQTEPAINHRTNPSFSSFIPSSPASFLVQNFSRDPEIVYQKPSTTLNPRCILLLKNLITVQATNRFDRIHHIDQTNPSYAQFKFFMNTLEILCHYLNLINIGNYIYRINTFTTDCHKYLPDFPTKVDAGSIITVQAYLWTLQNGALDAMKEICPTLENSPGINKKLLHTFHELSLCGAQYHMNLRSIFKELSRLGYILDDISSTWTKDTGKLNSIFFPEGIWHPKKKVLYVNRLFPMLKEFENTIRQFEQTLLKSAVVLGDYNANTYMYTEISANGLNIDKSGSFKYTQTPSDLDISYKRTFKKNKSSTPHPQTMRRLLSEPSEYLRSPNFGKTPSYMIPHDTPSVISIASRTPNSQFKILGVNTAYEKGRTPLQSTQPTNQRRNLKEAEKEIIEVKPWAEEALESAKIKHGFMTPLEGIRNIQTAKNTETSMMKMIDKRESINDVYQQCNQLIALYSGWKKPENTKKPNINSDAYKENDSRAANEDFYGTPKIRLCEGLNMNKKSTSKKGDFSRERRNIDEGIRSGSCSVPVKEMFQQARFNQGKVGKPFRLLNFR